MELNGDALPLTMEAAERKHGVLGMTFLKHTSDPLEYHTKFQGGRGQAADTEDTGDYHSRNILWMPSKLRWASTKEQSMELTIGWLVDDVKSRIQHRNLALATFHRDCVFAALDKLRLRQLIDLIHITGVGDPAALWLRRDTAQEALETIR